MKGGQPVQMAFGRDDFESIVRANQAMVFSIAYHFFHDRSVAEEVAQDVFLQLFENIRSIESAEHLVSWLRRTSTHRCIDVWRKRSAGGEVQVEELPEAWDDVDESDPLRDERLRRLVASLPETQRAIVILRYT